MRCRVCGREFDPRGFQVVVPGFGIGFDRVDCALEASAAGVPLMATPPPLPIAARPPALALPTVATAGGPAASAPAAASPSLRVGANLALLAAGAAATVYLWLRVFSPDAAVMRAPVEHAAAAFGRSTVSAGIDLTTDSAVGPQPETVAFGGGPGATATAVEGSEIVAVSNSGPATTSPASSEAEPTPAKGGGSSGPVVRPMPPPAPPPPPEPAPPPRQTPAPVPPVPTSPPEDRVPGPTLPGPGLPDSGPSLVGGDTPPGS
jgi:hypothetical protein